MQREIDKEMRGKERFGIRKLAEEKYEYFTGTIIKTMQLVKGEEPVVYLNTEAGVQTIKYSDMAFSENDAKARIQRKEDLDIAEKFRKRKEDFFKEYQCITYEQACEYIKSRNPLYRVKKNQEDGTLSCVSVIITGFLGAEDREGRFYAQEGDGNFYPNVGIFVSPELAEREIGRRNSE